MSLAQLTCLGSLLYLKERLRRSDNDYTAPHLADNYLGKDCKSTGAVMSSVSGVTDTT